MIKKIFFILSFSILTFAYAFAETSALSARHYTSSLEPIYKKDRVLILAPHPDDEAIGCAGIIQQALTAGAQVQVLYLTNGEHNEFAFIVYEKRITFRRGEFIHMGQVRRREAVEAMKLLGLSEDNLTFLGYPDFGTFNIFCQYWQSKRPFKDLLTRISAVPYKDAFNFGAEYWGENILEDLKKVLLRYQPNKIFVSHPADVNVDHKTFYLFLEVALADLEKRIPKPEVYPYLVHRLGWPMPRHYHPELSLEPPDEFLGAGINWEDFDLTSGQIDKKHQAILKYKSQTESSAFYLLSFARKNELFSDYPEVGPIGSLIDRAASFFGPSNIFPDLDIAVPQNTGHLGEEGRLHIGYAVKDDFLLIRVKRAKKISYRFSLALCLFGYSYKTAFPLMPKIRIFTKNKKFKVFNKNLRIEPGGISLEINSDILMLKVPLKMLGSPDFILASVKAYSDSLPVDALGFRKIIIK